MPETRWQQVKTVFGEALELPVAARPAYLVRACGDDLELRREVERLLAAEQAAGSFLSQPAAAFEARELHPQQGRRIGSYRVLGESGRGGMGLVLRAVRDDDVFEKTVALKLVHVGASAEQVHRFTQERQILARLQHPNIASIFDGGTSDEGQPYLVMEYVEGEPIDSYCSWNGLSIRERVRLFRTVCDAVDYAHQNFVVHRDLKPENILVTRDGQPKLVDFGIAKLLDQSAGSMRTATLLPVMTPSYASPEQVRGQTATTASEVYSLGVVLYELLTGKRPYVVDGESLEEILAVVCEIDPRPPSECAPEDTADELRGDLDTIVLKALRKESERRYATVRELSEDLRRHLEGLPVLARADTLSYRATKFVSRHRVGVAAAALVLASLVAGLVATAWQWRRAEANRHRAEERLADVRALTNSFLFEFHDAIATLPGSTSARKLVVERAAQFLDRLERDGVEDVELEREIAMAYQRLGDAQGGGGEGSLGDVQGALASYRKALSHRGTLAEAPGTAEDVEALAHLEMRVSRALGLSGDWGGAEETAQLAATRLEGLAAVASSDLRGRLASLYHTLGFMQARRGDRAAALASLEKAAAAGREFAAAHPEDRSALANVARLEADLVEQLQGAGRQADAMTLALSSWATLEELIATEPDNARYRRDLIYSLNVGSRSVELGSSPEAANRARRRALELARALVAAEPKNFGDQLALGYTLHYLGAGLVRGGEIDEGLDRLRDAVLATRALNETHPSAMARNRIAEVLVELGMALTDRERYRDERCAAMREGIAIWEALDETGDLPGENREDLERARTTSQCAGTS